MAKIMINEHVSRPAMRIAALIQISFALFRPGKQESFRATWKLMKKEMRTALLLGHFSPMIMIELVLSEWQISPEQMSQSAFLNAINKKCTALAKQSSWKTGIFAIYIAAHEIHLKECDSCLTQLYKECIEGYKITQHIKSPTPADTNSIS
jgi:hypothetical protein